MPTEEVRLPLEEMTESPDPSRSFASIGQPESLDATGDILNFVSLQLMVGKLSERVALKKKDCSEVLACRAQLSHSIDVYSLYISEW